MAPNHHKVTFFDFQSVYTQNDRNFALILNFSLIFEKTLPKSPKMAKNGPKSPQSDFFDFQSVYTQNDRNFALILNLSVFFEKNAKSPKMAKNGKKCPKITKK